MLYYRKIIFFYLLIISFNYFSQTAFSPNNLSGLQIWLTGDYVKLNSTQDIDTIYDLSSNHNHAFQLSSNLKPKLSQTNLSGHKTILFDGIDDYVNFNSINTIRTVFWVIKERANATPNYRPLLGDMAAYDFHRGGDSTLWQGATNINIRNGITRLNQNQVNGSTTYLNSKFYIISVTTTGNVTASNFANDRGNSGRRWDGNLAELIIYNQALTPIQVTQVEDYLRNKYAPPVNIGPNKNICSFPYTIKAKKDWFTNYTWQNGSTADSLVVSTPGTYSVTVTDIFGKTSSSSVTISLDNSNYQVNLGNDTIMCHGQALTLNAGPNQYQYLWSNASTQQSLTINSSVTLTVSVTNCLGYTSSDNITVTYPNYHLLDSVFCSGESIIWNTNHPKNQFSFLWSDNSSDSLLTINTPGQYYVTIFNNHGCTINSNTITVNEDHFPSTASLGPDVSLCSGNSITLVNGANATNSYTWNTGSHNDSLLISNTGQYSVIATNTNNCIVKDTINVTILGQAPVADFTTGAGCLNSNVSFTNLSTPPVGNTISSYDWNFGDIVSPANTATISNPFHTFSDTGNYTIRLKVITNVGCEQSISKTLHIAPSPTVNFASGISCQNDSTSFSNLSIGSSGYPIALLNWNFGDPSSGSANTSQSSSPKHLFSNQANYTIKLVATNNAGCKDSLLNIIAIKAQVKADFNYTSPCSNTSTLFQDNSIVPTPSSSSSRLWNFGTSTATGLSVSRTYTSSGVYSVSLTVNGSNGCISKINKIISIYTPPIANFTVPAFCSKDTVTAVDLSVAQSGIINSYNWQLNNSNFASIQNPTLSINSAGNYPIKLIVSNSFSCKDSITKTVNVFALPLPNFTTNPANYYFINTPINFVPTSTTATSYLWNIETFPPTSIQSPTVIFAAAGSYSASLNIQDLNGCKNSISKNLIVTKQLLDVAILNVNTIKDLDGFMTVQTDIANYGTVPVSSLLMSYQISDGGTIKETWLGTLNPSSLISYTFNAKSETSFQSSNNMTCVNIQKVNGVNDENDSNNHLCNTINSDETSVANPIPNPTANDITLPVILNKDIAVSIAIYNSIGQKQQQEVNSMGIKGLNLISLPTTTLAQGCYIIKTTIDDKVYIKKFIKLGKE